MKALLIRATRATLDLIGGAALLAALACGFLYCLYAPAFEVALWGGP